MAATRSAGFARARTRLIGLAFLAVIVGLVLLTVALYNKSFTPVIKVSLKTDRVGNQLTAPADVKVRGLVVGEVREVRSAGDGATVELALDPDQAKLIPRNVEARFLPKTLFGEKFVNLVVPPDPTDERIADGDVIAQDRSRAALETSEVLDDLLPLLQSLKPDDLSRTLNALSGALRGRGERIGENAVLVDRYLKRLNPALPELQQNLRGLADLSDTLDDTAPDFLAVFDNLSFSSRSLVDQQDTLMRFLQTTTTFSGSADSLLRDNEQRFVALARDSLPSLQVFARYSGEFPCMFKGLTNYERTVGETFGGLQPGLHITLETTRDQGAYTSGDEPRYRDTGPADCRGLPSPPTPAQDEKFADGYRDGGGSAGVRAASDDPALLLETPEAQRMALDAVVAPVLGVGVDEVPDLAEMLFGPAARGTLVELS